MTVVLIPSRYPPCDVCGNDRWIRLRYVGSKRSRIIQCPHCGPQQLPIATPNESRSTA